MKIYSVKENIGFDTLSLGSPVRLQGGSYYSKLFLNNDSVFLKIEYCSTKQGIVETNNKTYTDLLFTVNESEYVDWVSDLETKVKEILTTKANDWFTQNLSEDDIEHFYNSCIKTYKTNQTLLRTFIDMNSGNQKCSIFDENKIICGMESVENRKIATILHIKGIRLTSTSFQLDIENKQILLLDDKNVFEECMIDVNNSKSKPQHNEEEVLKETVPLKSESKSISENLGSLDESKKVENNHTKPQNETNDPDYDCENLKEIDLNHFVNGKGNDGGDLINESRKMKLKTPQDVYLEMYQLAKKRAKETRKQAIKAYIDAQNIKAAYLIKDNDAQQMGQYPYNDISDDDSDSSDSDSDSGEYEGDDDDDEEQEQEQEQ